MCVADCTMTVYPSGGLFATRSAPIVPAAPPRLSMMNCWPVCSDTFWNTMRPVTSFDPPGGNTMITRTGFAGYACAQAVSGAHAASTRDKAILEIRDMRLLLRYKLFGRRRAYARGPITLQFHHISDFTESAHGIAAGRDESTGPLQHHGRAVLHHGAGRHGRRGAQGRELRGRRLAPLRPQGERRELLLR